MKIISFLSVAAIFSGAAFLLGVALDAPALAFFTVSVSAAVLLIASYDYTPRRIPAQSFVPARRRRYTLPLAA